jgi:hypothetical protein
VKTYLLPAQHAPREDELSESDKKFLEQHFMPTNHEVVVDNHGIDWSKIDEIEIVQAARDKGPSGWFIRFIYFGGQERYHVGIYSGRNELVLPNLSPAGARYVLRTLAYYARNRIEYKGPADWAATVDA